MKVPRFQAVTFAELGMMLGAREGDDAAAARRGRRWLNRQPWKDSATVLWPANHRKPAHRRVRLAILLRHVPQLRVRRPEEAALVREFVEDYAEPLAAEVEDVREDVAALRRVIGERVGALWGSR